MGRLLTERCSQRFGIETGSMGFDVGEPGARASSLCVGGILQALVQPPTLSDLFRCTTPILGQDSHLAFSWARHIMYGIYPTNHWTTKSCSSLPANDNLTQGVSLGTDGICSNSAITEPASNSESRLCKP